jgi:prepilin-type processing-associated H-X9-DG protein
MPAVPGVGRWVLVGWWGVFVGDTKTSNPMFCPNAAGKFDWPNDGLYSGHTGGIGAFYDYGPNTFVSGFIFADGKWYTGGAYPSKHEKMNGAFITNPVRLAFFGDAYGYGARINNTPSNRHQNPSGVNIDGKINITFLDGHTQICPKMGTVGEWNISTYESYAPGGNFYVYGNL